MFFNFIELKSACSPTNKNFLTLLHLRQFQNLSEETWTRASEN